MKETRILMGMPITVDIADAAAGSEDLAAVFDYFTYIDRTFSTYKPESEMMRINRGELPENEWSDDMRIVLMLSEETKQATGGFFDIRKPGNDGGDKLLDPSGLVKGWAIWNAAGILRDRGFSNFYVDAGGDIQTSGMNNAGEPWSIGIKNPLKSPARGEADEIIKVVYAPLGESDQGGASGQGGIGVATSGTYIRGKHIYNPKTGAAAGNTAGGDTGVDAGEIVSLTVIGPNIYEADRFATAAFAMGSAGIHFLEALPKTSRLEGYMINMEGVATMTTGFKKYIKKS
jgi:thiamine biosynthesis lipoprotein